MYDQQTGRCIRRPHIRAVPVAGKPGKVRMTLNTVGAFDLEPLEALSLANYLVDAAEQVAVPTVEEEP